MTKTTEELEEIIYKLFKIIDDIDTISDMVKGNYHNYHIMVDNKQKQRWNVVTESFVTELYEKFHENDASPKTVGRFIPLPEESESDRRAYLKSINMNDEAIEKQLKKERS